MAEAQGERPECAPRSRDAVVHVVTHSSEPASRLIWIYAIAIGAFQGVNAMLALFLAARFGVTENTIGFFFTYIGVDLRAHARARSSAGRSIDSARRGCRASDRCCWRSGSRRSRSCTRFAIRRRWRTRSDLSVVVRGGAAVSSRSRSPSRSCRWAPRSPFRA